MNIMEEIYVFNETKANIENKIKKIFDIADFSYYEKIKSFEYIAQNEKKFIVVKVSIPCNCNSYLAYLDSKRSNSIKIPIEFFDDIIDGNAVNEWFKKYR